MNYIYYILVSMLLSDGCFPTLGSRRCGWRRSSRSGKKGTRAVSRPGPGWSMIALAATGSVSMMCPIAGWSRVLSTCLEMLPSKKKLQEGWIRMGKVGYSGSGSSSSTPGTSTNVASPQNCVLRYPYATAKRARVGKASQLCTIALVNDYSSCDLETY